MRKVLVTGASGFIGGHLAETLSRRGEEVRCLVRPSSSTALLDQRGLEVIRASLDDASAVRKALDGVEVVYNVAGAVAERRRGELQRVNVELTSRFAALCASRESPPVFVHVSSAAATGPTRRGNVRQPGDPPRPVSKYGRTKFEGERQVIAQAANMPVTVVRPGAVFGERDRASATIFRMIRWCRCHPILGFRTPPLSVIHVAELVEILLRAADGGKRVPADPDQQRAGHGCYFACLDEYPTYARLGFMVRQALGCWFTLVTPIPYPISWPIAAANQLLAPLGVGNPLFNPDKLREAAVSSWACSPAAAFQDLAFTPRVSFQERLRQTAEWYRTAGWL